MRVIIFGATGMIGQGVLRECLVEPQIESVLTVGRKATGQRHTKLEEIERADLTDLSPLEDRLKDLDACFFCLGVSSAGMSEQDYRRITHDLTLAVAATLHRLNPQLRFIYVSGQGTDTHGRSMWARVKGETEDALLAMPWQAYMFRPGYIQPMHGARSRTRLYAALYVVAKPLYPVLKRLFPDAVTSTERIGKAMIKIALSGTGKQILASQDINSLR